MCFAHDPRGSTKMKMLKGERLNGCLFAFFFFFLTQCLFSWKTVNLINSWKNEFVFKHVKYNLKCRNELNHGS